MSLFQCRKCGCAEDTALCHYWSARLRETEALCSACDPTVGKWQKPTRPDEPLTWVKPILGGPPVDALTGRVWQPKDTDQATGPFVIEKLAQVLADRRLR
jgi:hypothetical protein